MSVTTVSRSDPVPIPNISVPTSFTYKEIVRNLTANSPQPYGAIPPLMKKRKPKKKKRRSRQPQAVRRMSHVENWIAVDSKESLPDEEELVHSQNFLPFDFLTGILPLHMPPPSLSDPATFIQQQEVAAITQHYRGKATSLFSSSPGPHKRTISSDGIFNHGDDDDPDDEDEDLEDDDDIFDDYDDIDDDESDMSPPESASSLSPLSLSPRSPDRASSSTNRKQRGSGTLSIPTVGSLSLSPPATARSIKTTTTGSDHGNSLQVHKTITSRRSIPSFTKAHTPSTLTTTSFAMSSSPPDHDRGKWVHTIAKLRQSLALTQPPSSSIVAAAGSPSSTTTGVLGKNNNDRQPPGFIPMPLPPKRKRSTKKRRSEATTQPRFNFDTNTYTRDTRSNPDHLRMIAAELNMMRSRKLFSPLKPRGFLPRRKDPFVCGNGRLRSPLQFEIV